MCEDLENTISHLKSNHSQSSLRCDHAPSCLSPLLASQSRIIWTIFNPHRSCACCQGRSCRSTPSCLPPPPALPTHPKHLGQSQATQLAFKPYHSYVCRSIYHPPPPLLLLLLSPSSSFSSSPPPPPPAPPSCCCPSSFHPIAQPHRSCACCRGSSCRSTPSFRRCSVSTATCQCCLRAGVGKVWQ